MLKIRWSHDRLIFNMGIPIPGKDGLYIEMGPWTTQYKIFHGQIHHTNSAWNKYIKTTALYVSQHQIKNNCNSEDECLVPPVIYVLHWDISKPPFEDVVNWNVCCVPWNGNYINMSGIIVRQFACEDSFVVKCPSHQQNCDWIWNWF